MQIRKNFITIIWLIIGTAATLIPSFIIRVNFDAAMKLYVKFGTYLSDLWNFYANYLGKGLHFPPEYPIGIRWMFETFHFYQIDRYSTFIFINFLFLAGCAIITTYFLYLIIRQDMSFRTESADGTLLVRNPSRPHFSNIWYFWILAPSFIFYGIYNYDLPTVMLAIISYYFFTRQKFDFSSIFLALGAAFKFFPIYLLPIFIINTPAGKRFRYILIFTAIIIAANLPYMISNFDQWIYPYVWQISNNISVSAQNQTFWWLIYPITGKLTGFLSLGLFGGLYCYILYKLRKSNIIFQIIAILILFLLTDRIYSPQYNLYLLPFLALASYKIKKLIFYPMEILNVSVVFFFFWLTKHTDYMQTIVFLRYSLLVILFWNNYKMAIKQSNSS